MEHSLDQILLNLGYFALTAVGAVAALFGLMRATYGSIIKTLQDRVTELSARANKSRRIGRKREKRALGREQKCREDMARLKEEMGVMRRQCPVLNGETGSCTVMGCPTRVPDPQPRMTLPMQEEFTHQPEKKADDDPPVTPSNPVI